MIPSTQTMHIEAIPAYTDNYIWLLHNGIDAVVVDPGEEAGVLMRLAELNLTLRAILVTHHHFDHIDGIDELLRVFSVPVYGPGNENIRQISHVVGEGDRFSIAELGADFLVLATPGHTRGHIVYLNANNLFCGDTLFSAGCGRNMECEAPVLHHSLQRLAILPGNTLIYCTHEYTLSNLAFAQAAEPDNVARDQYLVRCKAKRQRGDITLPTTMAQELLINPYLRCDKPQIQSVASAQAKRILVDEAEVFSTLRHWKNRAVF